MGKICFKCKEEKLLGEFYKHKGMVDGRLGKCKECTKRDVRQHRQEGDRPREYDRERFQNNPERRKKTIEAAAARSRRDPIKYKAHYTLRNAVRDGRIEKPDRCSRCNGKEHRIEGHHPDHSKPLDVVWLCVPCHRIVEGVTIVS